MSMEMNILLNLNSMVMHGKVKKTLKWFLNI